MNDLIATWVDPANLTRRTTRAIAIIWQIERRRWRRQEGFRVSICHEKFLLHLNQGAPPQ